MTPDFVLRREGLLLCLVGPSGGGKTTFAMQLLEDESLHLAKNVSLTTRPMREGEREGREYFFVSREEFQERIARGELLEWEEVHGHLYGSLEATVTGAIASGQDLILDIDIRGALKYKRLYVRHAVVVFICPPSTHELVRRVKGRGSITEQEVVRRLETARREYHILLQDLAGPTLIDYVIINHDRNVTYQALRGILEAERNKAVRINLADVKALCPAQTDGGKYE